MPVEDGAYYGVAVAVCLAYVNFFVRETLPTFLDGIGCDLVQGWMIIGRCS
jgi:hypothetical protein